MVGMRVFCAYICKLSVYRVCIRLTLTNVGKLNPDELGFGAKELCNCERFSNHLMIAGWDNKQIETNTSAIRLTSFT